MGRGRRMRARSAGRPGAQASSSIRETSRFVLKPGRRVSFALPRSASPRVASGPSQVIGIVEARNIQFRGIVCFQGLGPFWLRRSEGWPFSLPPGRPLRSTGIHIAAFLIYATYGLKIRAADTAAAGLRPRPCPYRTASAARPSPDSASAVAVATMRS